MKISDLNKGDKIFCTKTLMATRKIKRDTKYYERLNYFNNTDWTDLTEEEKIEHNNFDFRKEEEYEFLIKNKYYTIKSKFANEIDITNESNYTLTISNSQENNYNENFLNEYFVTDVQSRKIKLEELSDKNFNNFLKDIKSCVIQECNSKKK